MSAEAKPQAARKLLRDAIWFAVIAICFYFIYRQAAESRGEIVRHMATARPGTLFASLAAILASFLVETVAWRDAYRSFSPLEATPGFPATISLLHVSSLLKYIPGKVWVYVSQLERGGRLGFRAAPLVQANILSTVAGIGSGLVVGSIFFFASPAGDDALLPAGVAGLALGAGGCGAYLFGTDWLVGRARRWSSRIPPITPPAGGAFMRVFGLYLVSWGLAGVGGILVHQSLFGAITGNQAVLLASCMAGAWSISFLSFLAPGGFGIREGVMFVLMKQAFGVEAAVAVPLVSRAVYLVAEMIMAGVGAAVSLRSR